MAHNSILGDGGLHHIAIRVADFEKSIRFYTDVLGFAEKIRWGESPKQIALLDTGNGSYVELFEEIGRPPAKEDAMWHVAFRVPDADAALERCRAAGCEVTVEPKTLANVGNRGVDIRLAFCKGPSGELLEFFSCDKL